MPDALNHGKLVLGTILGHRSREALDYALRRLEPGHFTDNVQRNLWQLTERYLDEAGHVMPRQALEDALRGSPPGTVVMYLEYFDSVVLSKLPSTPAGLSEFQWSVKQLRELAAERLTGEALAEAMEILRTGKRYGPKELQGHSDARSWLVSQLSAIDRRLRQADAPEGDVRHEGADVLKVYGARKGQQAAGNTSLVSTGVGELDKLLGGGLERGELVLTVGWTSSGKTSFVVNLAWYAAAVLGKNVVFFTSETLRPQVRIKLLARHSRLEKFGLKTGLNSRDIKAGTLTPAGERKLQEVAADYAQTPGKLYLAQSPRGSTVSTVEASLSRITRDWPADLVIYDYAGLLKPETSRKSKWEELSGIIMDLKEVAATYRGGLGVPLVTPWQVSREAFTAAKQRGYYMLNDLASTQDAPNTADVVLSLMAPEDFAGGRDVTLEASLLKNRDGEAKFGQGNFVKIRADYATSYFTADGGANVVDLMNYQAGPGAAFG
jgi:replicative DNA helicase